MQKAIVVRGGAFSDNTDELNVYLQDGWKLVNMCDMSGASSTGKALVIVEKEEIEE